MDERDALLHAIALDADDVALRLVLADWLEENGEALHASFIRAQCTLDGLLVPPPVPGAYIVDVRYLPLAQIDPRLLPALLEPFAGFIEDVGADRLHLSSPFGRLTAQVRRGLVEEVSLVGRTLLRRFLPYLPFVFARLPVRSLTVLNRGDGDPQVLGSAGFASLLGAEGVGRLEEMNLSGIRMGKKGMQRLQQMKSLPWKRLVLNDHGIDAAQQRRLLERFDGLRFYNDGDIPF